MMYKIKLMANRKYIRVLTQKLGESNDSKAAYITLDVLTLTQLRLIKTATYLVCRLFFKQFPWQVASFSVLPL